MLFCSNYYNTTKLYIDCCTNYSLKKEKISNYRIKVKFTMRQFQIYGIKK